jgi:hypothetical protein|tara:strand:- start:44 stop:460 length:417 start_codon:yes stop_codon:yes gene_type:complete
MGSVIPQAVRTGAPLLIGGGITSSQINPEDMKGILSSGVGSPATSIIMEKVKGESIKDTNIGKVKDVLGRLGVKDSEVAQKIAEDMVGDYDDAVLGDDEIMGEIMNREDVKEQIKKDREDREPNAQGGMIDKPLYDRA